MRYRRFVLAFTAVVILLGAVAAGTYLLSNAARDGEAITFESGKQMLFSVFDRNAKTASDTIPLTGVGDPPPVTRSYLTGTEVNDAKQEKFLAVMIDLAPAARPLFRGVEQAKWWFEMPAEGGVPRIMAIFSSEELPPEIGPVRSARDYFVEIAEGIAGGYVHAGGSPDALDLLYTTAMTNYDERTVGFQRDPELSRPHNLFLVPSEIIDSTKTSVFDASVFPYSPLAPFHLAGETATRIDIDISTRTHAVAWNYDPERNCYKRQQERETMELCVENVVVLGTDIGLIAGDEKGRLEARTIGNGTGLLFRDGIVFPVSWERETNGVFRLLDAEQNPVPLHPGRSFFEILDTLDKVGFSSPG